jgi:hypothetical protein
MTYFEESVSKITPYLTVYNYGWLTSGISAMKENNQNI